MSIAFTPHAVFDIDDTAEAFDTLRTGKGAEFRQDVQKLLARLERLPRSAALYAPPSSRWPGLRVAQLGKFRRYAVFYQTTAYGIVVVRCLNATRNITAIFGDP